MTPKEKVLIEVEISFNEFINVIMEEFGQRFPQTLRNQFMNASTIEDGDLNNLKHAIDRTANWIKDYYYGSSAVPSEQVKEARRAIEQLGSILHIGMAYPDKAATRAIQLRPKMVEKK